MFHKLYSLTREGTRTLQFLRFARNPEQLLPRSAWRAWDSWAYKREDWEMLILSSRLGRWGFSVYCVTSVRIFGTRRDRGISVGDTTEGEGGIEDFVDFLPYED